MTESRAVAGRPPRLTPPVLEQIRRLRDGGMPVHRIADEVGLTQRSVYRALARTRPPGFPGAVTGIPVTSESAPDELEADLVRDIVRAARHGEWRAAAFVLERRWPERWARGARGAPSEQLPPDEDDVFAAADELAER